MGLPPSSHRLLRPIHPFLVVRGSATDTPAPKPCRVEVVDELAWADPLGGHSECLSVDVRGLQRRALVVELVAFSWNLSQRAIVDKHRVSVGDGRIAAE